MSERKDLFDKRKTYYDHEPAYKALSGKNKTGWRTEGKSAPFSLYWNFFKATQLIPKPRARVLDFGCGGGEFSLLLAKKGFDVVGIDYSKTAIKMAKDNAKRRKIENVKFYCRDALNPGLASSSFDAVFSIAVLHCLIGPDRQVYWNNARDALKKGGVIALTSMVDFPRDKDIIKQFKISKKTRMDEHRSRYFASEKQIIFETDSAGLDVIFHARKKEIEDEKGCDDFFIIAKSI